VKEIQRPVLMNRAANAEYSEPNHQWWEDYSPVKIVNDLTRNTKPKPDLTYAFPIFKSRNGISEGFSRDDWDPNFHVDFLANLRREDEDGDNLCCSLTVALRNLSRNFSNGRKVKVNFERPDLFCFPWAVVEFKRDNQKKAQECYSQAANAAAVALEMREALIRTAVPEHAHPAAPVVAFTCVGPEIRLWLAYGGNTNCTPCFVSMQLLFLLNHVADTTLCRP
jgi:hypothetical protein